MVRFGAILCLGVPIQCQRLQFYRRPWCQRFYRDFMAPLLYENTSAVAALFSQLGLEPNHPGWTAQSIFFLGESWRTKRSDTQTFSNYFKRVLSFKKRSSTFSK